MDDLISRQAAIEAIKRYAAYNYDLNNGLNLAMNAVTDLPTVEPTEEMIKEYCRKRCLCIVTADLFERWKHSVPMDRSE